MSYAQAVKFSRNHRKDRFFQPIVLGEFHLPPHVCHFSPHYAKYEDAVKTPPKPDYYSCLRCGNRKEATDGS